MAILAGAIAITLWVSLALWSNRRKGGEREDPWEQAAQELGLEFSSDVEGNRQLAGMFDGLAVLCATRVHASETRRTVLSVTSSTVSPQLEISKIATHEAGRLGVKTGDHSFDEKVFLGGPEALLLSVLNHDARVLIANAVVTAGLRVHASSFEMPLSNGMSSFELTQAIRLLISLAKHCSPSGEDFSRALAERVKTEPLDSARLESLNALIRHFPKAAATLDSCTAALKDPMPHIRLCASAVAPVELAVPAMREVLSNSTIDSELRVRALQYLAPQLSFDGLKPLLEETLAAPDDTLNCAALELAAKFARVEILDAVVGRLEAMAQRSRSPYFSAGAGERVEEAAARALGNFADARAETALISLLQVESTLVRRAAAVSLLKVGTVRAVEPLLMLTRGLLADGVLKETARDAIRTIQSRLGNVDAGRVSVVATAEQEGAVTVVENGGAVSVAGK